MNEIITEQLNRIERAVLNREKPFMGIHEASQYIGVSVNTLYAYVSRGVIAYYKLHGRRLYFAVEDLDNFILAAKNRRTPRSELERRATAEALNKRRRRK